MAVTIRYCPRCGVENLEHLEGDVYVCQQLNCGARVIAFDAAEADGPRDAGEAIAKLHAGCGAVNGAEACCALAKLRELGWTVTWSLEGGRIVITVTGGAT